MYSQEQDYTKKFDLNLWLRVLKLAKDYRGLLLRLSLSMIVIAFVDILFIEIRRYLIDEVIVSKDLTSFGIAITVWITNSLLGSYLIRTFIILAGKVETGLSYDIRQKAFTRLQELSFTYYDQTSVGFIMSRMTSDTRRLSDTIGWVLVDLLWASATIVFTLIAMMRLNFELSLIIILVLPILAIVSIYFQRIILKSYRIARKTNSQITSSFNEGIMGARTSKTLLREDSNLQEFKELTTEMKVHSLRAANYSALFFPIVNILSAIGSAVILSRGGGQAVVGNMTIGTLIAMVQYSINFFDPLRNISRIFADLQSSQASAERVMTLLETEPDIVDALDVMQTYGDSFTPYKENWEALNGDIKFEDVSFHYKEGEVILDKFNLEVKSGQTIALVGETGSGKSTIVNLICRFYEPNEGRIYIDGRDIKERSQLWLQSNLGYVLQQPHLFTGTVRENIRYGKLEATDEEVEAAAKLVNADDFILHLDKGYDTEVGEGGNRLSTGEKQLISFARAILADPKLFVLDEATSSIDTETEQIIQNAIHSVLQGRTSFIVAHRLSTVRSADRILVIEKGKIIEDGSHRELLRLKGHYYSLYTNQFLEERRAELLR